MKGCAGRRPVQWRKMSAQQARELRYSRDSECECLRQQQSWCSRAMLLRLPCQCADVTATGLPPTRLLTGSTMRPATWPERHCQPPHRLVRTALVSVAWGRGLSASRYPLPCRPPGASVTLVRSYRTALPGGSHIHRRSCGNQSRGEASAGPALGVAGDSEVAFRRQSPSPTPSRQPAVQLGEARLGRFAPLVLMQGRTSCETTR